MPREKLRELVAQLHEELEETGSVDAESRALLEALTVDIDKVVGDEPTGPEEHESALEQVEEAAVGFEAEHPRVAGILREIFSALSRVGI